MKLQRADHPPTNAERDEGGVPSEGDGPREPRTLPKTHTKEVRARDDRSQRAEARSQTKSITHRRRRCRCSTRTSS